jgi:subtilisin family serine protease
LLDPAGRSVDLVARVENSLFLGSGTCQAAAVVSGLSALLIDLHPQLTPDQVKAMLTAENLAVKRSSKLRQGSGGTWLDLEEAVPDASQMHTPSTGLGSTGTEA